jgi:hypothetical protein
LLWSSLLHIYYNWVNFVLSEWVSLWNSFFMELSFMDDVINLKFQIFCIKNSKCQD